MREVAFELNVVASEGAYTNSSSTSTSSPSWFSFAFTPTICDGDCSLSLKAEASVWVGRVENVFPTESIVVCGGACSETD